MTGVAAGAAGDPALEAMLAGWPRRQLLAMHAAALDAVSAMRALARRGASVLTEALAPGAGARAPACEEWAHYPEDDVFDPKRGGLAYYHAHAADERAPGEHGHFHLFASPHRAPVGRRRSFVHLMGVSVDAFGQPLRVFTTNRWVTAESWRDAPAVLRLASRFELRVARPSRALNRWLGAMPALFRPQLERLLAERDAAIRGRVLALDPAGGREARERVLEDRALHVVSECPVSLYSQVRAIERALAPEAPARRSSARRHP